MARKKKQQGIQRVELTGYTLAEVAEKLDRSQSALRRWIRMGWVDCGQQIVINGNYTYLFSDADVDRLRQMMHTLKPGPRTH